MIFPAKSHSEIPIQPKTPAAEEFRFLPATIVTRSIFLLFLCATGVTAGAADHARQATEDARHDRTTLIFDGQKPNSMVCDTALRELPDGTWVMVMRGGGDHEPAPENHVTITYSRDQGKTWTPMAPAKLPLERTGLQLAQSPSELMVLRDRAVLYFSTHDGHRAGWKSWLSESTDGCRTWSVPQLVPGRLQNKTYVRNHIVTRDGRILLPFQHHVARRDGQPEPNTRTDAVRRSRNGVLISSDRGRTWSEHGNIKLTNDEDHSGFAENNLVELSDGRIAMIIRADRLGGVLYYAESRDGGRTWPEQARKTDIPNPGSKATIYGLGGDSVALVHNPNPKHRSPLALWVSFDGMKTWPYRRVLVKESSDGPQGRMNYPDGFVSRDRAYLHFAFDDNRHRAVYYGAKLPPLAAP